MGLRLFATAALAAALLVPAPALARAPKDPLARAAERVAKVVDTASQNGAIAPAAAASYRESLDSTVRVLGSLDTPHKATRRDELGSQLLQMSAVADRGDLTGERLPAFFRQLDANREWFAAKPPPSAQERVQVPGDPLVYGYYPGHGLQLQPLFNWTQANRYWFAKDYASLQALIDALAPLAVPQPGGWIAWEYLWDYGSGKAPWKSGMAQGVALQVLARAWQATGSTADLDLAHSVLPGFGVPTSSGGLVDPATPGWWPLYAFDPAERVLNGDLQVVVSLYDYAAITGDPTALAWAQLGTQTALAALPAFDTGAWSMYDQSHEADLNYHDLMTTQLGQIATKSGVTDFRLAALRFAAYRVTPPVLTAAAQALPEPFFPWPADGLLDTGAVTGNLDKTSSITLTVLDGDGAVVAAESLGRRPRGPLTVTWNGRVRGQPAAPGDYTVAASAVDVAGNRADPVAVGQVRVVRDVTPPQVLRVRVGRTGGHVRLVWAVRDATTPWVNVTVRVGSRARRLFRLPQAGVRVLDLKAPRRSFVANVRVADTSGNAVTVERRRG